MTELIYFLLIIALEKFDALDSISLLELLIKRETPIPNAARIIHIFSKTLLFIREPLLLPLYYTRSLPSREWVRLHLTKL